MRNSIADLVVLLVRAAVVPIAGDEPIFASDFCRTATPCAQREIKSGPSVSESTAGICWGCALALCCIQSEPFILESTAEIRAVLRAREFKRAARDSTWAVGCNIEGPRLLTPRGRAHALPRSSGPCDARSAAHKFPRRYGFRKFPIELIVNWKR